MPQGLNQEVLQWDQNLVANNMNYEDRSEFVYMLSNYNTIDYLISKLNNAKTHTTWDKDGKVQTPIMGGNEIVAQVAATPTSPSAGVLRVLFTDPTFDKFRNQEIVTDGTSGDVMGRIIAHGAGYIDLTYCPPLTAWSTSLHFQANSFTTYITQVSPTSGSMPMESRYNIPKYVSNYTSVLRENLEMYRRQMGATWAKYKGQYWYSAQDEAMIMRIAYAQEMKALLEFSGIQNEADGTVNYSMGAKAAIKDADRGGVYTAFTSAPTQGTFENFIGQIADNRGGESTILDMGVGRGFLRTVQGFVAPYIAAAGELNTFGGVEVEGIDSYMFAVNGIKVRLNMVPFFNDRKRFPTMSTIPGLTNYTLKQMTAVVLDFNSYPVYGGGTAPAMRKVQFGNDGGKYYYVPGIIGSNLKGGSSELTQGDFNLAVTHNDCVTIGYFEDTCYDFMAHNMGWIEAAY